jgi:hypothetical protein
VVVQRREAGRQHLAHFFLRPDVLYRAPGTPELMHRRNFLSARTASFKRMFEAHALVHHKHYAEILSDAPVPRGEDKEIRLTVRKAPIKAMPFAAVIAWWSSWPCLHHRHMDKNFNVVFPPG